MMTRLAALDLQTNAEDAEPTPRLFSLDDAPPTRVATREAVAGQLTPDTRPDVRYAPSVAAVATRGLPEWMKAPTQAAMVGGAEFMGGAYNAASRMVANAGRAASDAIGGITRGAYDLTGTERIDTTRADELTRRGDPMGQYLRNQAETVNRAGGEAFQQEMRRQGEPVVGTDPDSWAGFAGSTAGSMLPAIAGAATGPVGAVGAAGTYAADAFYGVSDEYEQRSIEQTGDYDPEVAKSLGASGALLMGALEYVPIPFVQKAGASAARKMIDAAISRQPGWRTAAARELAKVAATGAVGEGTTEAMQELTGAALELTYDSWQREMWAEDPEGMAQALARRVGMAALGGAVGGGVMGGAATAAAGARDTGGMDRAMQRAEAQGQIVPDTQAGAVTLPTPNATAATNATPTPAQAKGKTPKTTGQTKTADELLDAAFMRKHVEVVDGEPKKVAPKDAVRSLRRAKLWPQTTVPDDFALEVVATPGYERIGQWLMETPRLSRDVAQAMFGKNAPKSQKERNDFLRTFRELANESRPDSFKGKGLAVTLGKRDVPVLPPRKNVAVDEDAEIDGVEPTPELDIGLEPNWRADVQDKYIQIEKFEQKVAKATGAKIDGDDSLINALRLSDSVRANLGEGYMERFRTLLNRLKDENIDPRDVNLLGIAEHSPEANDVIARLSADPNLLAGMTNTRAAEVIREMQARPDYAKVKAFVDEFRSLLTDSFALLADSGAMTEEMRRRLENYQAYWPIIDDPDFHEQAETMGAPLRFATKGSGIRARTGREFGSLDTQNERLQGILDTGLARIQAIVQSRVSRVVRQGVGKAMIRMATKYNAPGAFQIVTDYPTRAIRTPDGERRIVPDQAVLDRKDIFYTRAAEPFTYGDKEFNVGDPVVIKVGDEALGDTLKNAQMVDDKGTSIVRIPLSIMRALATWTRRTATLWNPFFWTGQVPMDLQDAMATVLMDQDFTKAQAARIIGNAFTNSYASWWAIVAAETLKRGKPVPGVSPGGRTAKMMKRWAEFEKVGGRQGMMGVMTYDESIDLVRAILNPTKRDRAEMTAQKFDRMMERVNEPFNSAMRLAFFDAMIEAGVHPKTAAVKARDVQIDFMKRGKSKKLAAYGAYKVFLNASIQGVEKQSRMFKSKRGLALAGTMVAAGFLARAYMLMQGGKDEDRDGDGLPDALQITRQQERTRVTLPIPGVGNVSMRSGWIVRLPIQMGAAMADAMLAEATMGETAAKVGGAIADAGNPLGGGDTALTSPYGFVRQTLPTGALYATDLIANENYAGDPIYTTMRGQDALRSESGMDTTPQWAKDAAQYVQEQTGVDMYPEVLSFTLRNAGGGIWSMFERTGRAAHSLVTDEPTRPEDVPFLRDFLISTGNPARSADDYYRMRDRAAQFGQRVSQLEERGDFEALDDFIADNPTLAREHDMVFGRFGTERILRQLRKERRQLREMGASDPEMAEYTQERIDQIREMMRAERNRTLLESRSE